MKIREEEHSGVKVLVLEGELTIDTSEELEEKIKVCLKEGGCFILDLSSLAYVDSSGLGILVQFHKSLRAKNGKIVLASLTDNVRKVMEITRLIKLFEVFPSRSEAVHSIGKG